MFENKKKCFVITPIGNDNSEIRRHIDGIIDEAIIPAIANKYEINVAHRKYEIGSINDRIIKNIYESDLVIANLTDLNPNVMFELAIRYSFAKPAIVIAEKDTRLPFDVIDENTIFYVNDPAGAKTLKNSIIEYEKNIDYNHQDYGPVYKIINQIPMYKSVESGENVSDKEFMSYIINRLDTIENKMGQKQPSFRVQGKPRIDMYLGDVKEELLYNRDELSGLLLREFKSINTISGNANDKRVLGINFKTEIADKEINIIIKYICDFFKLDKIEYKLGTSFSD